MFDDYNPRRCGLSQKTINFHRYVSRIDNVTTISSNIHTELRQLPALNALRAFEAAARHESFSRAADELFVTHGAVSHQIRGLESELGVALFARDGKRVRLTDRGRQYVRRSLAMEEILSGRLVRLFNFNIDGPSPWMYYFVCPPALLDTPRVQAFREWIFGEVEQFRMLYERPPASPLKALP